MHIGIVTHKVIREDGQGRVNFEVAEAALARGHTVTLVASEVDPALARRDDVRWAPIAVDGWPTELVRNQIFAWRSHRWLQERRGELDLLLANGSITWTPADVNVVHFVHSAWLQSPANATHAGRSLRAWSPRAWYHWLYSVLNAYWERFAFRQADVVVAVSETIREQLLDLGVPAGKVRRITNGVDPDEFHPGTTSRSDYGLPADVPLAFFVGDIQSPRKNLDTVLKALRRVPPVHLAVAGDATESPYPALAERLGVADRVHFLGFRSDIPALMRAADFFVFPSRYEPFALVVVEAMASGLPVITARNVGAARLVSDAGIVLDDPDDEAALARAMQRLAGDPGERAQMGALARDIACRHDVRSMAGAYVDLLESMGPGRPSDADAPIRSGEQGAEPCRKS